ncbi:MAG: hypothetical protein GY788_05845 [bacterium]|nr:hypothetical protein [bacterium]
MERRLSAIMAADMVAYSRLMEADEIGTIMRQKAHRTELIDPTFKQFHGRIVKTTGDGLLAEFPSVVDAVQCAVTIQRAMVDREADIADDRRIQYRIGINLSDVVVDDDDIYGDGVNVAARLEGMAEPSGMLISQPVYTSVADKLDTVFFDNGERKFKNIARRIRVWSWPRKLPSLRAGGKPRVFVADFNGPTPDELQLGADLGNELRTHLDRLTGMDVAPERANSHYAVEGDVRLATGRARIFARLVTDNGERQIWSERYDEHTGDAFDILDRCAPRISMGVRRRVAADDAALAAKHQLDELSLEELLSLAGVSFYTPTKAGWRGGGEIAEQALEIDPDNFMGLAMASAGLGLAEYFYGYRDSDPMVTELACKRADKALRQNNRSDMLYVVQSGLHLFVRGRYRNAVAAARQALEVNPDYNMGFWTLGMAQVFAMDFKTGIQNAIRAVDIDLRDPYVHLYSRTVAHGYLGIGNTSEAVEWFLRADRLAPGLAQNLMGLAVAAWLDGDETEARHTIERLVQEEPEFRLSETHPLPYKEAAMWKHLTDTLRAAGAPE